jgi:hypothetical protein
MDGLAPSNKYQAVETDLRFVTFLAEARSALTRLQLIDRTLGGDSSTTHARTE